MPRWLYLVLAVPLLYAGFVQSFWGNDPYLGWAITVIASVIIANPLSHMLSSPVSQRADTMPSGSSCSF
jgi:hypothetical protein